MNTDNYYKLANSKKEQNKVYESKKIALAKVELDIYNLTRRSQCSHDYINLRQMK